MNSESEKVNRDFKFSDRLRAWFSARTTGFSVTATLYLRLLGLVFFIAIVSFWVQLDGLVGKEGILPVDRFMGGVAEQLTEDRFRRLPTLSWLDPTPGFLHFQCSVGVLFSLLLMAGLVPSISLVMLWLLYLSLTVA
ncbi:MAG: hypothetical protein AAF514_16245, partial [Verrucomicrobiota bacterium]